MKKLLQVALGVIAAMGGFVDVGELVFNVQAGAQFTYQVLWAVVVGVVGIMVYAEMCGRVATITQRPVFEVVRLRFGFATGLIALIASEAINVLTLAAEVGGIALVLQLLFADLPFRILLVAAVLVLAAIVTFLPFGALERIFGYAGLMLLVYVVAMFKLHPDAGHVAAGFVPHWQTGQDALVYWYFVVGVIAAAFMPYEVYFYSSGAVEEGWKPSDLIVNKGNAILGFGLGGILSAALIVVAAKVFHPAGVQPEFIGTTALAAQIPLGQVGLLLAFGGMLFAVGGAAIEVCFAGAYSIAQFLGRPWGKGHLIGGHRPFAVSWAILLFVATAIVFVGANPTLITEYAVVLGVVALPLTYLPVLLIARDRRYMGEHANGRLSSFFGWLYLAVIVVLALAAIPLLFATNHGSG